MWYRLFVALLTSAAPALSADQSAVRIMAQVAANQDKAVELRRSFIFQQHIVVTTRHFNGKLARQETSDYTIAPTEKGLEKKLSEISGHIVRKGRDSYFKGEPIQDKDSLDAELVSSFRDDLLNEKNKDGVAQDLFPLTTGQQKNYRYQLLGHKTVAGRDTYVIGFSPGDSADIKWAGEAWVDTEELQPVRVFTHLSRRLPFVVRTMLGTDLPGIGFNLQYRRLEKDVWFPESFGSEFRLRAVFFIKRDISMSMQASGFRRAEVDSTVSYEAAK